MEHILETERLLLREFNLDDTAFIIELLNSKGWIKYIGDRNIRSTEQAEQYLLNGAMKSYRDNGYGLSMVALKSDGTPIGMAGILKRDTLNNPDIGFALLPEHMDKGYAYEIAAAIINFAKDKLNILVICAISLPENTTSVKLLNKIGLKYKSDIVFPGSSEILHFFSNEM